MFLEIPYISQEITCVGVIHGCFPVKFAKFLRNSFFKKHIPWMRLKIRTTYKFLWQNKKFVGVSSNKKAKSKQKGVQKKATTRRTNEKKRYIKLELGRLVRKVHETSKTKLKHVGKLKLFIATRSQVQKFKKIPQ